MSKSTDPAHEMGPFERGVVDKVWKGQNPATLPIDSDGWLAAHTWNCQSPNDCTLCMHWRDMDSVAVARHDDIIDAVGIGTPLPPLRSKGRAKRH